MKKRLVLKQSRHLAREFVADYVRRGREWSTVTVEGYLPAGYRLSASISGPVTIESIAQQIHDFAELIPAAVNRND